jgi:hypothetical protein
VNDLKYPYIRVKLMWTDGNAYAIIGRVCGAPQAGVGNAAVPDLLCTA